MKTIQKISITIIILLISINQLLSQSIVKLSEVTIDKQIWASENLIVKQFRNNEPILQAKNAEEWTQANENKQAAWCYYNFDPKNETKYGLLYNWYAVNDNRGLAPEGYIIPLPQDFKALIDYLGAMPHRKLKSQIGWSYNGNGNNSSRFNALPNGFIDSRGNSKSLGENASYWTKSYEGNNRAFNYEIEITDDAGVGTYGIRSYPLEFGCAVRCLKLTPDIIEREEKKRIEVEKRNEAEKIKFENRKKEEARKNAIKLEKSTINDLQLISPTSFEKVNEDVYLSCSNFLNECIKNNLPYYFKFECQIDFIWSPSPIEGINSPNEKYAFIVPNSDPYLYCIPQYSINQSNITRDFEKHLNTKQLAFYKKEYEGEVFYINTKATTNSNQLEYIINEANIKIDKNGEITFIESINDNQKIILTALLKDYKKGKYKIKYQLALLNDKIIGSQIVDL